MFSKYTSTPLFLTLVQLAFAAGFGYGAAHFGSIPLCILYVAMFGTGAVATANPKWRTVISYFGLIFLLGAGVFIVLQPKRTINLWYIGKIVFVVYYSVFVAQIFSTLVDKDKKRAVCVLGLVFFVCFMLELGVSPEAPSFLQSLKVLAAEGGGQYGWKDLIQDICFGIGAAIAIELYKPQEHKVPVDNIQPKA